MIKSTQDESLVEYFKGRIELLEFSKDSIESDVVNGIMSQDDYAKGVEKYNEYEKKNYERAKKAGLDLDNIKIIELRLGWLKEDLAEINEAEEEEDEEEEPAQ